MAVIGVPFSRVDHPRSRGVYRRPGRLCRRAPIGGRDHPRSRGVYRGHRRFYRAGRGSSPLARGLLRRRQISAAIAGIIPARAGFTIRGARTQGGGQDHPRSRGVYPPMRWACGRAPGSSPLARGLRSDALLLVARLGIIPARAGFTARRSTCRWTAGDHPRSRGVYDENPQVRPDPEGSSPLARGLPIGGGQGGQVLGIIPARAGFT